MTEPERIIDNWALAESAQDLELWVPEYYVANPARYRPGYANAGDYYFTHYEYTGLCWWCGGELTGRQQRWCKGTGPVGHWHSYYRHFSWNYARDWCSRRYDYQCANCGWYSSPKRRDNNYLEIHHIIPLEGAERNWTPYNLPWNLICLCHLCHMALHAAMRPSMDPWENKLAAGQLVLIREI